MKKEIFIFSILENVFKKLAIIIVILGLLSLCVILYGCGTLNKQDNDYFEREYKRFQEQQEEPYIPSPRDF